jgi:hypothetical protein
MGLKLNGKYQLGYVDDVKVLGNNIDTIKKITPYLALVMRLVQK